LARKARKIKDKWKEKKWVTVIAPDSFNDIALAYIPITDDKKAEGRVLEVTLHDILKGDPSQHQYKIFFQIEQVVDEKAKTFFKKFEYSKEFLRSLIRRGSSKVTFVINAQTKDGNEFRIKALSKMISSNEIVTLINALGLDPKVEDIDLKDLRYGKIIIMTDADVDGSHIRTLLLTFFNNKPFNKLIENGHVYLAQPPLYKINKGSKGIYIKDEKELEEYILNNSKELKKLKKGSKEFLKGYDEEKSKMSIQRFKGLGEMNPEELWSTTLNPETRNLLQVQYSKNVKKDQDIIHTLMGNDVALRKDFIVSNAINVSNLDI